MRRDDVAGVMLILGAVAAVVLVAVAAKTLGDRRVRLDATGCPVDGVPSIDAVLYDASDAFSPIQLDWTRQRLTEWLQSIPKHGNLKIFLLSDRPAELKPRFDRCNPGSGDDESYWIANPAKLKRNWQSIFKAPAIRQMEGLGADVMGQSPLLESIQALGVRAGLGAPHAAPGKRVMSRASRRLLLVTDLLQHSENVSLYRTGCGLPSEFVGSSAWQAIRADLTGLDVSVLLVRRAGTRVCEERALIRWWEVVLGSLGASLSLIEPLPGLAPASATPGRDK